MLVPQPRPAVFHVDVNVFFDFANQFDVVFANQTLCFSLEPVLVQSKQLCGHGKYTFGIKLVRDGQVVDRASHPLNDTTLEMGTKVVAEFLKAAFASSDDVVDEGFWIFNDELDGLFCFSKDFVKLFSGDARDFQDCIEGFV